MEYSHYRRYNTKELLISLNYSAMNLLNQLSTLPWIPKYTQASSSEEYVAETEVFRFALMATIAFTVAVYSFEGMLDARQKRAYQVTEFPKELEKTVGAIDNERKQEDKDTESLLPKLRSKFVSAQTYGLDKINFGIISSAYETFESVVFLLLGFMPYIWDLSVSVGNDYFGWTEAENEIKISLIFLAVTTVIGTITQLPFELYSTFRIEHKHGFNKMTLGLFFTDKIKSLVLTALIGGPFVSLLLFIIKSSGPYFYVYVWFFFMIFSVFMMTIVPVFIMPLFNKYEPLKDGDLKTQIFALAKQLEFPLTKLFVMDGSKRSAHSNAFMFGFGSNKRIVLFDTLMEQVHDDEILAILGHELGHWKLKHTWMNFITTQLYVGAAFYTFSLTYNSKDLFAAFGFDDAARPVPTLVSLLIFFQTVWSPVDKVLSFFITFMTRVNEFAADRFSVGLGMSKKLQSGLCKIHLENLGAMCPDRWYSTYHYSHPPLVERLAAMMAMDQKNK